MKKKELPELVITIEKLVSRGEGLARYHGKVVLVPFVLPGEEVRVQVTQSKREYDRAFPIEILKSSIHRRPSECTLFQKCGGCQWQHIQYSEQLYQKQLLVQEVFLRMGKLDIPLPEIVSGSEFGYRNRVQIQEDSLGVRGFMARKTEEVISVETCPVLHPMLQTVFEYTPTSIVSKKTVREKEFQKKKSKKIYGFGWEQSLATYNLSGQIQNTQKKKKETSPEVCVSILGKPIYFDLQCFFQSNLELLPDMIEYVIEDYSGNTALDLYCGVGLFGSFLKDSFKNVVAIEENKRSMLYAKKNIASERVQSKESSHLFISQPVEKVQDSLPSIDFAVVDPPRPGLTKQAKEFLLGLNISKLVYVSCDPVTLARDLKELLANGYTIQKMKIFDFYPQTFHIESVVHLAQENGGHKRTL